MGYRWVEKQLNRPFVCRERLKHKCLRVKKAFQCMRTMGVSGPSLHRESTDSLIYELDVVCCLFHVLHLHYTNILVTCSIAMPKSKHSQYAKTEDSFTLQYLC